jgi:membrane protein DedA with SNARE-associated domain
MERIGYVLKTMLVFGLAIRLRHHFSGPPIDYYGVAAAAAASWVGIPGPGEPILIAAAIFAAKHKLDITGVLIAAFLGATAGGILGWLVGLKAGRAVMTARGPLHQLRLGILARGDEIFERYTVVAIILTPAVIAGIHHVRTGTYLIVNVVSAVVWAVGIGLAAYFVGPAIVDLVNDIGWVTVVGFAGLVCLGIGLEVMRRRRHHQHEQGRHPTDEDGKAPRAESA